MKRRVMDWILVVAATYALVSMGAYRLMHPELTETQLFLDTFRALLWR